MLRMLLAGWLVVAAVAAQDGAFAVVYEDGRDARVELVELAGEEVVLRHFVLGGQMTVRERLAEFTPASRMLILEAGTPGGDFASEFALARQAAEWRLLGPAGRHAQRAIEAAADTPEAAAREAEVREWAAAALERGIERAVEDGDLGRARHCLKLLSTRLADHRTEEQLEALAAKVEGIADARRADRLAQRQSIRDKAAAERIEARRKPIQAAVQQADRILQQAIRNSRSTVRSANLAEQAIERYRAAWTAAQRLHAQHPDDPGLAQDLTALGEYVQDAAIRAALHAANVLTVQSDYRNAMDWTNKVLAFDPDNAEAKEMRRTIQIAAAAASSQWGWGWQVVGGPPGIERR